MSKAVIVCGQSALDLRGFDPVIAVDTLGKLANGEDGCDLALLDIQLPNGLDREVMVSVETALLAEADAHREFRWAPIALQHVLWRFVRYYQYRLRLQTLLADTGVTGLVITSANDTDLVFAAKAACAKFDTALQVQDGPSDPPSSVLSYLATYDLPEASTLSRDGIVSAIALLYKLRRKRVFYQPYWTLGEVIPANAACLSWNRSLTTAHWLRSVLTRKGSRAKAASIPLVSFETHINHSAPMLLDDRLWPGFDEDDLVVLNSALFHFMSRYPSGFLDTLIEKTTSFFSRAGADRVVVNADNTCSARVTAFSARKAGAQVDFLPHGLPWEGMTFGTDTPFHPGRILAWSPPSRDRCTSIGMRAVTVSHPSNRGPVHKKRALPRDLANMRVLYMAPDWSALSFDGRPDCFEHDLLEVADGLARLGVGRMFLKCHHSLPPVVQAKDQAIERTRPYLPLNVTTVKSAVSSSRLLEDGEFDLAVIGPSTGIFEASRSSTPFIAYRAYPEKAAVFRGFRLPFVNSPEQLMQYLLDYDVAAVDEECYRLNESLNEGPHPLAADLEEAK